MKRYKYSTLANVVREFGKKRIMVIGDLLLDHFVWGEVDRISPEAPVPVVCVKGEDFMPGGACNVANNLSRLGAEVSLVGVVGKDKHGERLTGILKERDIRTDGIVADVKRPTILKTRVIAHHQQVVRIDRENTDGVAGRHLTMIQDYLKRNIRKTDAVIIEDYGKGMITPSLLKMVVPLAKRHGKIVAVDPKDSHFSYYRGVSVITPNSNEAGVAAGFPLDSDESLKKGGMKLLSKLRASVILITLGEKGMMVFEKGKTPRKISTLAQDVFDVSGAGDTVIAVYTLSVISGGSPIMAAHIANCAAGIVVGKVGTAAVEKEELLDRLKRETGKVR
ncbi:MAG: D-glycero-beta-D-manno-heptose-7-phosphate kinase [Candidatus Omnitrophota bacterium]|nr:D-glycero-beta-D-manno-heptose-7-phosphate kinase [Candidatus Omnitrophota bacterium]